MLPRSRKTVTALGSPRDDIGGESTPPHPHSHKRTIEFETDSDFSDESDDTILLGKNISTLGTPIVQAPFGLRYSVSDTVRRAVLANKPVALYKLLPGFDAQAHCTVVSKIDAKGRARLSIARDTHEKKLDKQLLEIGQMILSLQKYKSIVAEVSILRASNIDFYISNILHIYNSYPGSAYWLYHTHFWEGASEFARVGADVNWRSLDPVALQAAIARSSGPNECTLCCTYAHATEKCPFVMEANTTVVKAEDTHADRSSVQTGKPVSSPGKKKYCAFFNHSICRAGASCSRPHKCFMCDGDHGWQDCKLTPYINY